MYKGDNMKWKHFHRINFKCTTALFMGLLFMYKCLCILKGQGRIEKTEIIEMAIKHIKNLQSLQMKNAKGKHQIQSKTIIYCVLFLTFRWPLCCVFFSHSRLWHPTVYTGWNFKTVRTYMRYMLSFDTEKTFIVKSFKLLYCTINMPDGIGCSVHFG